MVLNPADVSRQQEVAVFHTHDRVVVVKISRVAPRFLETALKMKFIFG